MVNDSCLIFCPFVQTDFRAIRVNAHSCSSSSVVVAIKSLWHGPLLLKELPLLAGVPFSRIVFVSKNDLSFYSPLLLHGSNGPPTLNPAEEWEQVNLDLSFLIMDLSLG